MIEYRKRYSESTTRSTSPITKKGQAITVRKGKKKFKVIITHPNYAGSNITEGDANGKHYVCWFNYGSWSVSN